MNTMLLQDKRCEDRKRLLGKAYSNPLLEKILSVLAISLFFLLSPTLPHADESDIDPVIPQDHSFIYIIYDTLKRNLPVLYTVYTFRSEFDGGGEVPERQIFMNPGTYVINTAQPYDKTDFELELTENEMKKRFIFTLPKNKLHYALISTEKNGEPSLLWLSKEKGKNFIKRFVRVENSYSDD